MSKPRQGKSGSGKKKQQPKVAVRAAQDIELNAWLESAAAQVVVHGLATIEDSVAFGKSPLAQLVQTENDCSTTSDPVGLAGVHLSGLGFDPGLIEKLLGGIMLFNLKVEPSRALLDAAHAFGTERATPVALVYPKGEGQMGVSYFGPDDSAEMN